MPIHVNKPSAMNSPSRRRCAGLLLLWGRGGAWAAQAGAPAPLLPALDRFSAQARKDGVSDRLARDAVVRVRRLAGERAACHQPSHGAFS